MFNEGCCINSISSEEGAGFSPAAKPGLIPAAADLAEERRHSVTDPPLLLRHARSTFPSTVAFLLPAARKNQPASAQPPRRAGQEPTGGLQALAWATRVRSTETGRITRNFEKEMDF